MSSAKRIAANRRNARKSTGPRSAAGKQRSRMNALKHGLDAQTLILPGEDEAAYRARLDGWKADVKPRNALEESLVEQATRLSWQLERADRVHSAVLTERIRLVAEEEAGREEQATADAAAIGQRLIDGPPAPACSNPRVAKLMSGKRLGTPIHPDDPDHPERLLRRLQSSAAGSRWLLDRWAELRTVFERGDDAWWGPEERVRAVRLLAREPVDAVDDPLVRAIYLCSFVLDPVGPRVLADQADETTAREFEVFLQRLAARRVSDRVPPDRESAREELLNLVDGVMAGLESLVAAHTERASARAASAPSRLAFDDTPEGDRLRRLQTRLMNALLRTVDLLRKARRDRDAALDGGAPGEASPPCETLAPSPMIPDHCEELRNEPTAAREELRNEPTAVRPDLDAAGDRVNEAAKRTHRPRGDRSGGKPTSAWAWKAPASPCPRGRGLATPERLGTDGSQGVPDALTGPLSSARPSPVPPV